MYCDMNNIRPIRESNFLDKNGIKIGEDYVIEYNGSRWTAQYIGTDEQEWILHPSGANPLVEDIILDESIASNSEIIN